MRISLIIFFALCIQLCATAAQRTLQGTVIDASSGDRIEFATVTLQPTGRSQATDADGKFFFTVDEGAYTVTASYVGYKKASLKVNVTSDKEVTLKLAEDGKVLKEVVVTAKESTGMTSTSRINRDAMTHLQPTSFTDLLELLPGNVSQDPDMGKMNAIKLRETGARTATGASTDNPDYNISSLGTLFVVDGAPINGDANMQNIPSGASNTTDPDVKRDMTNKGVDMRTISTDNIESVEIVRGIPSAEYGNLTSGLVNIKRIRRTTPLTARFKADEYSKLVSVGKGFYLGNTKQILNVDGGFLDSKVDPRNNLENYKRVNFSTRFNLRFGGKPMETTWITGFDYTGSFDNAKTDPDLSATKVNEYKSRYNRMNYTSDLTFTFGKITWLKLANFNASASYQHDRLERRVQTAPQRASIAPTSMEAGVHDGQYLLSEYIADYVSDGKPLNLFLKLKAEGDLNAGILKNSYKVGGDWTFSKNYGDGQVYDISRPLSASWPTRPRAYKDIPSLQVLSWYAEDYMTLPLGASKLDVQAGVRTIQLPGLNDRYYLHGKVYWDPRVNVKYSLPSFAIGNRQMQAYVAGGYGITTKMPTISYLFPQVQYNDFIQLNYYDVQKPLEHSRVNLMTYIDDVTNYQLRAARNHKWEVRLGGQIGKNTFSITYFQERMRSGYRYSSVYHPYEFTRYDAGNLHSEDLKGPPALEDLPSQHVRQLDGYSIASNGSRLDKQGIEFVITTARWRPLATALTVTGAWFKSTYSNSQMLYQPVTDVVNNQPVRYSYIGLYDSNDGRVNEQFNTNFTFDTQITRWGLVFSTSAQCMWYVSSKRLWQNGVPASYLDVNDGQLHPYTAESQADPTLQFLTRHYNDDVYKKQTVPIAMYINLKATKEIGKHLKVAVFANRLLDYLPDYKSNGLQVRRTTDPYFGMEINVSL